MDTTTPPLACVPGTPCDVTVLTWNMHKGRDAKRRPVDLGRLAEALASVQADVLLLQEVFHAWTGVSQSGELARRLDMPAAYVPNARYARGHHGNATLASAALPLVRHRDISTNAYEHRGLLHVHFELPGRPHIHVMNTHLGLNAVQRRRQVHGIARFVAEHVPPGEPWVLGGDFNDWTPGVHTLVRRANGTRSVKVTVPTGRALAFRYLSEDGEWFNDPAVEHHDWQNGLVLT